MRIVSINAWCGTMWDELAAWAPTCGADVLLVQEVTRSPELRGWVSYDDGVHAQQQRGNLFADLADVLPGYQGSFVAHDAGPVDVDGVTHRQDFGMAVFVADHLPVIGQVASYLRGGFVDHVDGWPASDRPRLAQGVRVVDRGAGRTVAIVHLHGVRQDGGKGDTPERDAQAAALRDLVVGFRRPGDLVVVGGDLNLLPDSRTFDVLAEVGLTDLVGEADTRTSRYAKPVRHADYLLVSDPAAVRGFHVVTDPEVSDHRPLQLDL